MMPNGKRGLLIYRETDGDYEWFLEPPLNHETRYFPLSSDYETDRLINLATVPEDPPSPNPWAIIHELHERLERFTKRRKPPKGSVAERFKILKRDGFRCCVCGRSAQDGVRLEVDHRVPRSKGGSSKANNLWTLCFDCNRGKGATDL